MLTKAMAYEVIQHWRALKGTPLGTPAALLQRFGQSKPPFDPYVIAAGIGVELRHTKVRAWSGAVKFAGDRAVIWLNDSEHRRRKRFTLAHELGHLMLHSAAENGLFRDSSFVGSADERAANEFAAELVMPERALRKYAALVGFDLKRLARMFDVSEEALQVRLAILAERKTRMGLGGA